MVLTSQRNKTCSMYEVLFWATAELSHVYSLLPQRELLAFRFCLNLNNSHNLKSIKIDGRHVNAETRASALKLMDLYINILKIFS